MSEINLILFEIILIFMIYFFIFIYSAISSDTLTSCFSLAIFLILLLPFYYKLEELKRLLFLNNFENEVFYQMLFFYSILINLFIGLFLTVQLIYLFITQ